MISKLGLLGKFSSSYAIRNLERIDQMLHSWKTHLPYVKPYYAVKAAIDKEVIGHLSGKEVGFEVASKYEIKLVKQNAVNPDMIYGHPFKSISDLKYAKASNVQALTVDCIEEVKKIQSIDYPAKFIIRMKGDDAYSRSKMANKFGSDDQVAASIISHLRQNNLPFEGFCFHVGSACKEPKIVSTMVQRIIDMCHNIQLDLKDVNIIDIGGGMSYPEQLPQLDKELRIVYPELEKNGVRLAAEPGRLFTLDGLDLISKVIGVAKDGDTYYITIDDTSRSSYCMAAFFNQHSPAPLYPSTTRGKCVIRGRCPDYSDIIIYQEDFPIPKINDRIKFKNMGAYNLPYSSGIFNGFKKCLMVQSSEDIIRKTKLSYRSIGVHIPEKIESTLEFWKQNLPNVTPYYNLSAFPSESLVKYLAQKNVGLSVSYMKELKIAEKVVNDSNWMFSSVVKTEQEILFARKKGLKILTVDCVEEVDKISKIHPSCEILVGFLSKKEEIIERIEEKGLKFLGLSFDKGEKMLERVQEGLQTIFQKDLDYYYTDKVKVINLGGHFKNKDEVLKMKEILEEFKEDLDEKKIQLIAEPGTLLCKDSLDVYCKVIATKKVEFEGKIVHNIIVNDGVLHSFAPSSFCNIKSFEVTPLFESSDVGPCIIFGLSGAGEDRISEELTMPIAQIGDVFVIRNVGGQTTKYLEKNIRIQYI